MSARGAGRRRWRRGAALVVAALCVAVAAAAQERPATSAEDIVKGLLGGPAATAPGPAGTATPEARPRDEPADETPGITTRGIGRSRPAPRPEPGAGGAGGRVALPIQFELDSAEIRGESFAQLRAVAAALEDPRLQAARIAVEGHTDAQGGDAHNLRLSERRAEAVRRFLVEQGRVAAARLEARGYGRSRPLPGVSQETEAGRALNRRVEFVNLGAPGAGRPAAPPELTVGLVVSFEREGQVRALSAGGVLTAQDSYRVTFTASEPGHVYVFQIDATGRPQAIFPNPDFSSATNPVRARQAYTVPGEGRWFGLDATPGTEEIVVVASRAPLADAQAIALRGRAPERAVLTRGPAPAPRADVPPAPGVFSFRLPFEHR